MDTARQIELPFPRVAANGNAFHLSYDLPRFGGAFHWLKTPTAPARANCGAFHSRCESARSHYRVHCVSVPKHNISEGSANQHDVNDS
jgi:hypothetical protein